MNKEIELDPRILEKNLEITRITKDFDDLTSNYVELKERHDKLVNKTNNQDKMIEQSYETLDNQREQVPMWMIGVVNETHERMYQMMEWLERLQPVKLDVERNTEQFEYNGDYYKGDDTPIIIDLTDEEEMKITKLFRIDDELVDEDQTSRSILKDLRKVIKFLQQ